MQPVYSAPFAAKENALRSDQVLGYKTTVSERFYEPTLKLLYVYLPRNRSTNASLSVRLCHKQKKSPGSVSNKRPAHHVTGGRSPPAALELP